METEVASQKKNGETTAMNDIFKAFEPKVFSAWIPSRAYAWNDEFTVVRIFMKAALYKLP